MRIVLFAATNIAVLLVITVVFRLLGLEQAISGYGMNLTGLLIMSAAFGMIGSFISLMMSKTLAKRGTGARVIETPSSEEEKWLVSTVARLAKDAGIGMPEVAIFDTPQVNAFATGARRDSALVAVSTGLLASMNRAEAEAVLGHEVAHVANGDMVTLALIQGVVNTFVIFLSRIVGQIVGSLLARGGDGRGGAYMMGYFIASMVAQVVFGVLASVIVMYFSRVREFRADEGGARLAGKDNMIAALAKLKGGHEESDLPDQLRAFGISGAKTSFGKLFMSHPPLDERIAALKAAQHL